MHADGISGEGAMRLRCVFGTLFLLLFPLSSLAQNSHSTSRDALQKFTFAPLGFEENRGQFAESVSFVCQSAGYDVFLEGNDLVIVFHRGGSHHSDSEQVRLSFLNGVKGVQPHGTDLLPGVTHYYVGNDPAKWKT